MKTSIFLIMIASGLWATAQDCENCATVTDLDPTTYTLPYPGWDDLALIVTNLNSNAPDQLSSFTYYDDAYAFIDDDTIRVKNVSSSFNSARVNAVLSGNEIRSLQYLTETTWFIQLNGGLHYTSNMPNLDLVLSQAAALSKDIQYVALARGDSSFVVLYSDGTKDYFNVPADAQSFINGQSTIKRLSLSEKWDVAIVKSDGTFILRDVDLDDNQTAFLADVQSTLLGTGYTLDDLYLGPDRSMIASARLGTSTNFSLTKGPHPNTIHKFILNVGEAEITHHMGLGYKYQLKRSYDLSTWHSIGPEVTGDNTYKLFSTSTVDSKAFYRMNIAR